MPDDPLDRFPEPDRFEPTERSYTCSICYCKCAEDDLLGDDGMCADCAEKVGFECSKCGKLRMNEMMALDDEQVCSSCMEDCDEKF